MKETRKQKIDRQRGHAADRAFDPIRKAIDSGELVITPVSPAAREALSADADRLRADGETIEILNRLRAEMEQWLAGEGPHADQPAPVHLWADQLARLDQFKATVCGEEPR